MSRFHGHWARRWAACVVSAAGAGLALAGAEEAPPAGAKIERVQKVPKNPFFEYSTVDRLDRTIRFYLSEEPAPDQPDAAAEPLPLFVFVHGSGAQPLFTPHESGRIVGQCGQNPIADVLRGKARLLLVEKPGVEPYVEFSPPGGAMNASEEFRREHTLERWSEAVAAAIRAAWTLPEIDASRTLVAGHSEGGIVACRVAAELEGVTHAASLAGSGATQLYDLMALARDGSFYQHAGPTPELRVAALLREWDAVLAEPDAYDKFFMGHPHRRWSTFLRSSPMEELARSPARVKAFLATGTADTAVSVHSFDVAVAHLLARGRDVTWRRVEGADHGFGRAVEDPKAQLDGWVGIWTAVRDWFLSEGRAKAPGDQAAP